MGVHMVHAVLGVVLGDNDGRLLPVRSAGQELHEPAERQVIVRHVALAERIAGVGTLLGPVIVGQIDGEKRRQVLTRTDHRSLNSLMNMSTRNWSGIEVFKVG